MVLNFLSYALSRRARRPAQSGFAIAPILYLLGLIGVGAGVLFSGYSQILRSNQTMSNTLTVKNDLQGAATTLAASSWLSTDQTMLCPPMIGSNSPNTPSVKCSGAVSAITVGTSFAGATAGNLPAPSSGSGATGLTTFVTASGSPVEVGVFKAGAGVKVLDPWGHYYVYCRWENAIGTANAIMIISAGANGTLETKCGDTTAQGDDMFVVWTTAVTQNRAAVWQTTTSGTAVTGTQFGQTGSQVSIDTTGDITTSGNLTLNGAGSATIGTGGLNVTGSAHLTGGLSSASGNFTGDISAVNANFTGTLGASGLSTLGSLSAGSSTLSAATVTNNATIGGTLGVTGTTTLGTTSITGLTANGASYFGGLVSTGSSAIQIGTTVVATGSSSPLLTIGKGVGSPAVYPFTVDQFGAATASSFTGSLNGSQSGGSVSATTLDASGAATMHSTLAVTGISTLTGQLNGSSAVFSGNVQAASFTGTMTIGGGGVTMSGVIPIANGGTGQTSASAAWAALLAGAATNSISGSYLINNSVTSSQLNATGVTPGTYSSVTVTADGRITAGTGSGGFVTTINDGSGDSVSVSGSGITYSIGSSTVGNWTTTGLMIGTSKSPLDKLDVYGATAIGTGYAGTTAAPTNGLIVQGQVAIGTSSPLGALNVNGTVNATLFSGSGAGLTNIGTTALSGTVGTGNGGTGTNTVFTQGSVVFAGASGVYNQDNSNLFYDAANHKLGLGTATPTATLTVKGTTAYQFGTDYTTTGSQSDVNLGSTSAVRYNGTAAATFYGILAGLNGQIINLHNASSYNLTLSNLSGSESTAANQIITGSGSDMTMQANSSVVLQYDSTASKWRVIGGSGSGGTGNGTAGQVAYYQTTGTQVIGTSTVNIVGGQVGIGTAVPAALLHVNGIVHLGGTSGGAGASSGSGLVGGTSGQVQFNNGTGFAGDNGLYWDNTDKWLGIGTTTPTVPLTVSGNVDAMGSYNGYLTEIPNSSSGTTLNKLAKMYGANTVTVGATTDTDGMIGIVVGNAGTSGSAQIAIAGQAGCVFDSAPSAVGNWITISSTTAGNCHDSGTKTRSSVTGQIIGQVLNTVAVSGSTYPVALSLNGSGTGSLAGGSANELAMWTGSTSIGTANIYQSGGNVGIGTTSPQVALDVSGALRLTGTGGAPLLSIQSPFGNWPSFYNNSSGDFGLSEQFAGTPRLTIKYGTGNVGIGSTSPSTTLDVNGTIRSASGGFKFPDGTTQTTAATGGGTTTGTGTANYIPLWSSSSNQTNSNLYQSGGSIGLGTTVPTQSLDVRGPIQINNTNYNGTLPTIGSYISSNGGLLMGWNGMSTTPGEADFISLFRNGGNTTSGGFAFLNMTNTTTVNPTPLLYINPSGNVGIGTASPATRLNVSGGDIQIDNNQGYRWKDTAGNTSNFISQNDNNLVLYTTNGSGGGNAVFSAYQNTANPNVAIGPQSNRITFNGTATNVQQFYTNSLERMRIDASGNVGIGTANPAAKLDIASTAWNGLNVTNGGNVGQIFNDGNFHIESAAGSALWLNGDNNSPICLGCAGGNVTVSGGGGVTYFGGGTSSSIPTLQLSGYRPGQWSANILYFGDEANSSRYFMNTRGTNENNNADWDFYYFNTASGNAWQRLITVNPTALNAATYTESFHDDALYINSSGNVGIGTPSPTNPLSVNGNANISGLFLGNKDVYLYDDGSGNLIARIGSGGTDDYIVHKYTGGGAWIGDTSGTLNLTADNASTNQITLKSGSGYVLLNPSNGGKVGIGLTNPDRPLVVYGTASDPLKLANSSDSNWNRVYFNKPSRSWTAGQDNGNGFVIADETAGAYRFLIDSSGNVGIGLTGPATKLDVAGEIRSETGVLSAYNSSYPLMRLNNSGNGTDQKTMEWLDAGGTIEGRFVNDAYNAESDWMQITRNSGTYTTKNVLFPSGNVGIGTTSPGTKLDVAGGIKPGYVTAGASCAGNSEGSFGYDVTAHAPVYCSNSGNWTTIGASTPQSGTIGGGCYANGVAWGNATACPYAGSVGCPSGYTGYTDMWCVYGGTCSYASGYWPHGFCIKN